MLVSQNQRVASQCTDVMFLGAFYDLADTTLGVTHVVDLTVLYASQTDVISLADVLFGTRPGTDKYCLNLELTFRS